jgi:hypothetical protein
MVKGTTAASRLTTTIADPRMFSRTVSLLLRCQPRLHDRGGVAEPIEPNVLKVVERPGRMFRPRFLGYPSADRRELRASPE